MSQDEADTPFDPHPEIGVALASDDFETVPDSLENDAAEQRPCDGRGLFQFAVYKAAVDARKDAEPEYEFTPSSRRELIAAVNDSDAVNERWTDLGPSRRVWISKAHEWFPVPWEGLKRKIPPFDVFCNDDEVHYTWQGNPQLDEGEIRKRYRDGHWRDIELLKDPSFKADFTKEARRINHAKGYRYAISSWRPYFFSNGDRPEVEEKDYARDTRYMDKVFGSNDTCQWACGAILGEGGFGTALRYDLIDGNNTIRQRIVVKRDKDHRFDNDYERKIGSMLKDKSPYIVNYLTPGSRAAQGRKGVGYLEYAACGDLNGIIEQYRFKKWLIPEPFCWYLLHCLAEACFVLEKGRRPGNDDDDNNNWRPMFHSDVKPGNILLDSPAQNPAYWWQRNYPVPKLADLGGAAAYPNDADKKPDSYMIVSRKKKYQYVVGNNIRGISGCGTMGYMPFELLTLGQQVQWNRTHRSNPLPINQKIRIHTTIYQVGIVLLQVMNKRMLPSDGEDDSARHGDRFDTLPFHRGSRKEIYSDEESDAEALKERRRRAKPYSPNQAILPHYSHKLIDLVWKCRSPLAADRPTPTALWEETNQMMAEIDRMWPDPNSVAPNGDGEDDDDKMAELDYRSPDIDTDDGGDEDPANDPRQASSLYEDMREQFVDVSPGRVPALIRSAHEAQWKRDPEVRKSLRQQEKTLRRKRRRDKRRDDFFADYERDMTLFNERYQYTVARDAEERRYVRVVLDKHRARWDKMTEAEQDLSIATHIETWRKKNAEYQGADFSADAMRGYDEYSPPKRPQYVEVESSGSESDNDDDAAKPSTDQKEHEHELVTAASGRLLRRGPRMLAMPWDGRPVGMRAMRPDDYTRYDVDAGNVTDSEDGDDGDEMVVGDDVGLGGLGGGGGGGGRRGADDDDDSDDFDSLS